ncbi:SIS domain-containing protein [Candidatus Gottesmanbacteria bacterium]|nr:SIS domain-containing protein [Candidatus Gottesmanbacteria bacterium]
MTDLDDLTKIRALDKKNALDSIKQLPQQIDQAWSESFSIDFPQNYKDTRNIAICGMGGSTYGARIIKSLYDGAQITKMPIELVNNYWLPGYVNSETLVILSSYSGNTEETIACAKEAKEKGAKIIGITSGGQLAAFLKENNYPSYIFNPVHNPSAQPRIGVGYMVMGLIGMLARLGKIPVDAAEIEKIITFLDGESTTLGENAFAETNPAKKMAIKLKDKIPVIMVADFLEGAAYAIRNPFHETAKQFALYFAIPELNHHLLEGLSYPADLKKYLYFIFFLSDIYDKRNKKRMQLTIDVVKQNNIPIETISLHGYSLLFTLPCFMKLTQAKFLG